MAFTSFAFKPETPLFPSHAQVLAYFRDYVAHFGLGPYIRFNTRVQLVERREGRWRLTVKGADEQDQDAADLQQDAADLEQDAADPEQLPATRTPDYADLLLVANGHYRYPRYPEVPGVQAWIDAGKALHSTWYRRPASAGGGGNGSGERGKDGAGVAGGGIRDGRDKTKLPLRRKLLIVGGGPSGTDIADDLRGTADLILHAATKPPEHRFANIHGRPRVIAFEDHAGGRVRFADGSVEEGVEYVILATGYQFWLPFFSEEVLKVAEPPRAPLLPDALYNSTHHLFPLARNIWPLQTRTDEQSHAHYPPHTLAFIGLAKRVITWPVMEAEARAALAAFADPSILEGEADGVRARAERFQGRPYDIHVTEGYEQFVHRNELYHLAARAREPVAGPGSIAEGGTYIVQEWEKELFEHMFVLRRLWVEIVERGEAEAWLKGVGEGGVEDWMEMARKMLREAGEAEVGKLDKVEAVAI
ncbi:hypothetical protein BD626DRAFT_541282 [Schizophyllum amplum]|uniref:FAD/NAD(P)-binding domain-containing protein n=1 Tax=Schizophyllum amplum TaxID=97359 RepID=A0A550BVG0_9AGAR|nr:hypothetical protein BD626DRAFT_541282 [Auriculariopsis ampla]